ncbi:hypothetical protein GLAREA_04293 [Glarea lozoyensis ATCC 20868]|uniref:Heterokaryon incompatibility domain-containing protein n=1 Tax=Glarea lozoyensis (strain ATCC 20868 / MF5171) TaxID=1116229 RepID=S3CLX0_GLAL2|nr:uncharacterized protein GLAREA_04293 [Glarea lozoyensis ATCC 20868]EPE27502.1 hypothetical protein GLAREA_04293 [Glarea lozoyensis ATCC 20868]
MPNYEYTSIPTPPDPTYHCIRLLKLKPGAKEEQISISVFFDVLEDCEPYEALSYCWGDPASLIQIKLDDKDFMVTANLYTALLHLRREDTERTLWIDAICIDQKDWAEKGQQIALMRRIYATAERGVVWLGELGILGELGLGLVARILKLARSQSLPKMQYNGNEWVGEGLPSSLEAPWKGLKLILASPWFSRKWIIQELATPKEITILIGSQTLPWDDLAIAMYLIGDGDFASTRTLADRSRCVLLAGLRMHCQGKRKISLLSLLRAFSGNGATEPKDHIFGLKTLIEDEDNNDLFNYESSFAELSIQTARTICSEHKQLDSLKFVFGKSLDPSDDEFPSWVADWRPSQGERPQLLKGSYSGWEHGLSHGVFAATKGSEFTPQDLELPRYMTVRGMIIDEIFRIRDSFDEDDLFNLLRWTEMTDLTTLDSDTVPKETFCRVICGGRSVDDVDEPFSEKDLQRTQSFLEMLRERKEKRMPGDANSVYRNTEYYPVGRHITSTCFERRLIQTLSGHFGLVPQRANFFDQVCLLMGSDVPYILRQAGDDWCVVGHCYVDGLMKGEGFVEEECKNMVLV